MKASATRRVLIAAAWTVLFAGALAQLDRALLTPSPPRGWAVAATIEEIPAGAGPVVLPSYLPGELEWPPQVLRFRAGASRGWWLGVRARGAPSPSLWIGTGDPPLPEVVPAGATCLHAGAGARCPGDWHALSKQLPDGQVVFVLTTLDPTEASRVLHGLQREVGN